MFEARHRPEELAADQLTALPPAIAGAGRPVVLRAAVRHWPFVRSALQSDQAAVDYLDRFYNGRPVSAVVAPASERGRFFYRPDSKQFNFQVSDQNLSNVLKGLLKQKDANQPLAIAMQAVSAVNCLPGIEQENPNPLVPQGTPARLWISNAATVAPHFDSVENIACVAAGRRRFILFPPEQTPNLYPGPMDVTPAKVPISMVSLEEPELDRFPRFREAMEAALVAELEPGDAIYIPYMWWHGVQSLAPFNVLVNYWWGRPELRSDYPYGALFEVAYALYRDMPHEQRQAWRVLYDHFVFQSGGDPMEAFPPEQRHRPRDIPPDLIKRLKETLRSVLG